MVDKREGAGVGMGAVAGRVKPERSAGEAAVACGLGADTSKASVRTGAAAGASGADGAACRAGADGTEAAGWGEAAPERPR